MLKKQINWFDDPECVPSSLSKGFKVKEQVALSVGWISRAEKPADAPIGCPPGSLGEVAHSRLVLQEGQCVLLTFPPRWTSTERALHREVNTEGSSSMQLRLPASQFRGPRKCQLPAPGWGSQVLWNVAFKVSSSACGQRILLWGQRNRFPLMLRSSSGY